MYRQVINNYIIITQTFVCVASSVNLQFIIYKFLYYCLSSPRVQALTDTDSCDIT